VALLYADENFPLPVVEALRRLGHDVQTIQEAGRGGQRVPDDEVLGSASGEGRALLTINRRHFVRLHLDQVEHQGIIVCTYDPDFEAQAGRIHAALEATPHIAGQLIRVNRRPG
jgi:hypothetical protein